jgi:uncharacterized repeat protein (TIGR03847 family)
VESTSVALKGSFERLEGVGVAKSFDLDPLDGIAIGTVGPPGRRQFFLRAAGRDGSVVLNCEKFHVQGLITRILQLLEAQGVDPTVPGDPPPAAEPGRVEWVIGELGLGYHEDRHMFVIVAREAPAEEEEGVEVAEPATARFWASPEQLRVFARQAAAVVASGRSPCPYCGLPMDPSGHPCPASNGSRPVL